MRRIKWAGLLTASAIVLVCLVGEARASVKFGKWQKDPDKDRYYCEYYYPDKMDTTQTDSQICIYYPDDDARKNYYYFANKSYKIWGRCVCPTSPNYDPKEMQWGKLSGTTWTDLQKGDCPAPADGDPTGAAISKIPDPPA